MFRIFGPPGTGKTTTLLNMVEKAMESGIPPNRIGFFAFTKKAAIEARERAGRRFSLDPDIDLCHFRTFHSMAYRTLNVKEHQIMSPDNFKELSQAIGYELNSSLSAEDVTAFKPKDHPILQVYNLSRAKKESLRSTYNLSDIPFSWVEVEYVTQAYENYKTAYNLMDYHDMLQLFLDEADYLLPEFDLCFVDEAQDLSPIQWEIAEALNKKSKRMYVAGDDDQAIFVWAGADVERFITLTGGVETLEQSYRIPSAVHDVAEKISSRINNRFPKRYKPRQEMGSVQRIRDILDVDMRQGSWLILAQANYMLFELYEPLKQAGYLFETLNGYRSINHKMAVAISGWERLRKGYQVTKETAQQIYGYMSGNGVRIKRGCKTLNVEDDELLTLEDLQDKHGLMATVDMIWHQAMDRIPEGDRTYITNLLRSGEKFSAEPRIRLSTIHGAKGGEAENVILLTDLTTSAAENIDDNMHRVFYVGVTRTLQNLYLLEPKDYYKAYPI